MTRRWILALGVGLLLLVGADWVACRALMSTMKGQFNQWARNLRDQGFTVEYGAPRGSFTPWGARLIVPGLSISGGKAMLPGGLIWHAARVDLSLALLRPDTLTVTPAGEQTLKAAGLPSVVFFADDLTAIVPLASGRPDEIDITAEGFSGRLSRQPHAQDLRIAAVRLSLQAARGGAARTSARLSFAARGVGLPDEGHWPLGATIGTFDIDLSLASPALSGDAAVEQARAWRDWGGVLTVQSLNVHWGPLTLNGAAELGLDQQLQPEGQGEARVAGWADTLDALARTGSVQPGVAQTAKAVLALSARPGQGDAASQTLELPFTLQNSTLSVGKIPLMRINEVVWGGV
jgi:hypothetical protein